MKKSYQNGISENVRIRHYVMSLLYQNGTEPKRLPTSNQLAQDFGIARSTVLAALKQLREEGYITGKRGDGVFTNPHCSYLPYNKKKLIGLLLAGGDNFYYGKASWGGIAELGNALTEADWNVRPLFNVNLNAETDWKSYLEKQSLSALIMIHSNAVHAHMAAEVVPTILIGHQRNEPMPSIRFSYDSALKQLRKELRFQRPMFPGEQHWMIENNFIPVWTGRRIPQSRRLNSLIPAGPGFVKKLDLSLQKERPDVLFCLPDMAEALFRALHELKIDIPIVSWRTLPAKTGFHGYCFQEPYKEAAQKAVEMLNGLFLNGSFPSVNPEIPVPVARF